MTEPTAPATRTGAHALLTALEARGVRYLFGSPGNGAYPIFDALKLRALNVWRLVNPDFVRLGESFGLLAVRATTPDALAAAITEARGAAGSTLIEVPLEMLPPSELFDFRFGRAPDAPDA